MTFKRDSARRMTGQSPPQLSVNLLSTGSAEPLAKVLHCLQFQSLRSGIDILIVAPLCDGLNL